MIFQTALKVHRALLNDPYGCHIRACEAVDSNRADARMVFHAFCDWKTAEGAFLYLYTAEPVNENSVPFVPELPCWFEIRLNPAKRKNGSLIPLLDRSEIEEFVARKLAAFPIIPGTLMISNRHAVSFRKPGGCLVTINTVFVQGKISELPDDFETILLNGIGREKSFGYGTFHLWKGLTK